MKRTTLLKVIYIKIMKNYEILNFIMLNN